MTIKSIYNYNPRWQYNPLSKTVGSFTKRNFSMTQKSLNNHEYTTKLRESGYTDNHATFDKTGWAPHTSLNSDMRRTEYRIQYNKKEIHYKGPKFSVGKLKKTEFNYKHT